MYKIIILRKTSARGEAMKKKKPDVIRLDPEERICPAFDATSIKLFPAPDRKEMGVYVVDNCAEEHIM